VTWDRTAIEDVVQKSVAHVSLASDQVNLVATDRSKLARERTLAPWLIAASRISAVIDGIVSHCWRYMMFARNPSF
jgi:tellurite resistance protein